jgi:hypothetical protein
MNLGEFLSDRFLVCHVGVRGLYYEARRQVLHLPAAPGRSDALEFFIPQRMRIEIEEIRGT